MTADKRKRNYYYVNQLENAHIPYLTDVAHPENERFAKNGDIACAGCGICAGSMLVRTLTERSLTLEEYRDISYLSHANMDVGTDMTIYGAALAERFDLSFVPTNDTRALIACLTDGGGAIINVGGDHDDHIGIFSHCGHYIYARSYVQETGEIEILDPSYRAGKFECDGRHGKVRINGMSCFTTPSVIEEDTANRSPAYYLFWNIQNAA